jgi:hypothetical protein
MANNFLNCKITFHNMECSTGCIGSVPGRRFDEPLSLHAAHVRRQRISPNPA